MWVVTLERCWPNGLFNWGVNETLDVTYFRMIVTQRSRWCPSGELGSSSNTIYLKDIWGKNMKNRLILFKTFTTVGFYGENDEYTEILKN